MDELVPHPDFAKRAWRGLRLMHFAWTGESWESRGVFLDDCMNNYPPAAVGGRLFMTSRDGARRTMHTALSDSLDGKSWTVTPLPMVPPADRMGEPSWYRGSDGVMHILFRDMGRSGFLHHSISVDNGVSWSAPVRTNYPDATSKNVAGRLPDGRIFLINNPGKTRDPLAISLSKDGWLFDNPRLLRSNAPPLRYPGNAKHSRTFQYPHYYVHGGSLWVIYATNKEDIEISEYRLSEL